jgi:hypothetical protein
MSRRRELAAVAVLVLVFASGAAIAGLTRGESERTAGGPALHASAAFDSSELLFADPVHAEVDVVAASVPARLVRLQARFNPYRVESTTRTVAQLAPGRTEIRYRFTLSCLHTACAIANGQPGRMFTFPAALVSARGLQVEADWKPLVVFNRLVAEKLPSPRSGEALQRLVPQRASSWPIGLGAGLLLLGAAFIPVLLPRRRPTETAPASAKAQLWEALALARDVAASVSVARIRAVLEDLASELEQGGRSAAATRVRLLAWAEQDPAATEVAALTAAIEQELA